MDLLLDTHVLLWWDMGDARLSPVARAAIADPENNVFVSAASPWEIAIKRRRGKIVFTGSSARLVTANGFVPLAISVDHAERAGALEWDHADPFDRVLVSQAQLEQLVLVHADASIRAFGDVGQLWAR